MKKKQKKQGCVQKYICIFLETTQLKKLLDIPSTNKNYDHRKRS